MNTFNGNYQPFNQPSNAYPYGGNNRPGYLQNPYSFSAQNMQPQQNMDWIIVPSISQIEAVTVQPNQKAWIMAQNEPVFALKTADSVGLVSTDYYKFERYNPQNKASEGNAEFVTRDEMTDAIKKAVQSIKEELNNEPIISIKDV